MVEFLGYPSEKAVCDYDRGCCYLLDCLFGDAVISMARNEGLQLRVGDVVGPRYARPASWPAEFVVDAQVGLRVPRLGDIEERLDAYVSDEFSGYVTARELVLQRDCSLLERLHVTTSMCAKEGTAWHEAGHAVAAVITGRGLRSVTVSDRDVDTGGHTVLADVLAIRLLCDANLIRAEIAGFIAGPMSPCTRAGEPRRPYIDPDGLAVVERAQQLDRHGWRQVLAEAEEVAADLVETCWSPIQVVAEELLRVAPRPLSGAEVTQLIAGAAPLNALRERVPQDWCVPQSAV